VGTGIGGTAGATVAATVAATTVATSCRDPVASAAPRGGSLVVTALSAARDALDEHRLVGTDVPDLSTLVGARSRTVGAAQRAQRREVELQPLETGAFGGATAYLKVEKPRFLFLKGSADAAVAPFAAAAAPLDASEARVGASAARAAPSTDRPAAGASVPATGTCSSAASAALGDGSGGIHLSGGARPHHSLLPPPPTTSSMWSPGERAHDARTAGTPHSFAPGAPAAGCSSPSCVQPAPAPVAAPRARPLGLRAWAGQTVRHLQSPSAKNDC
jgi:hypothetical protein